MKLDSLFLQIFNMSLTGSVIIIAVILIRLLLKKAPKIFSYALWFVVLFRLLCPITVEAPIGVIAQSEVASGYELADEPISFLGAAEATYQVVRDVANGCIGIQHVRITERNSTTGNVVYVTTSWEDVCVLFGSYVWAGGIVCMVIYSTTQFWKLHRKLVGAVPVECSVIEKSNASLELNTRAKNVFLADHMDTPFVIGIIRPKVYLPSSLLEREREYVLLHEQHHIRRGDHIWKVLAFAALCLHWFNPLVWLAFSLYAKDMEMSCDEAIIRKIYSDIRAEYSESLLRFAVGKKVLIGAPLAFGESDTMARVKNVIKYKKPALWGCVAALVVLILAGAVLVTNPIKKETEVFAAEYHIEELMYDVTKTTITEAGFAAYLEQIDNIRYSISEFGLDLRGIDTSGEEVWTCEGDFAPYNISKEEIMKYLSNEDAWVSSYRLTEITEAYILRDKAISANAAFEFKDCFFLLLQTESGDTLLGLGWQDTSENGNGIYMEYLARLESTFSKGQIDTNFFNRLLEHATGEQINTFTFFESPGYLIVGFSSNDDDLPKHWDLITGPYGLVGPTRDMGFAVFRINSAGTGYKLVDYHLYEDVVADNGRQVYFAEHPAVANADGVITDKNAYDVIFCIDENIKTVVRVLDDGTELKQSLDYGMALLHWEDQKNSKTIKMYFLDENGNKILDYENLPINE